MTPDPGSFDPRRPTRRQLLKAGGLSLGARAPRPARAQTSRAGGVLSKLREANNAFLGEDVDRYEQA